MLKHNNGSWYTRKYCLFVINNSEYFEYEGEFVKGIKNGKGKEYNIFKDLIFEGEYINGKRYGKGKEYYLNGDIEFEGEY